MTYETAGGEMLTLLHPTICPNIMKMMSGKIGENSHPLEVDNKTENYGKINQNHTFGKTKHEKRCYRGKRKKGRTNTEKQVWFGRKLACAQCTTCTSRYWAPCRPAVVIFGGDALVVMGRPAKSTNSGAGAGPGCERSWA